MGKYSSKNSATYRMIRTTYCARDNTKNSFWTERDIGRVRKERCRKDCRHAGILHTHFDCNSALFSGIELKKPTNSIAK